MSRPLAGSAWNPVDPYDPSDPLLWIKIEHLGRYMFAARLFGQEGVQHVVDAGYGTGYGLFELAKTVERVVGLDLKPNPLPRSPGADRIEKFAFDFEGATEPPAELSERTEGITCFEVLEHLERPERLLTLSGQMLRADGLLVVSVPDAASEPIDAAGLPSNRDHRRSYSYDDLRASLNRAGFEVLYRLGQGLVSEMIKRESQALARGSLTATSRNIPCLHDADAVRLLAATVGLPTTAHLSGSYSMTVVSRLSPGRADRHSPRDG